MFTSLVQFNRAEQQMKRMSKKNKLSVILMMLFDNEEYKQVERKYWIHQLLLRRQERGAYDTINTDGSELSSTCSLAVSNGS